MDFDFLRMLLIHEEAAHMEFLQGRYTHRPFVLREHEESLYHVGLNERMTSADKVPTLQGTRTTTTPKLPKSVKTEIDPKNQIDIQGLIEAKGEPIFGKFFLCRTIAPPMKLVALSTVVEDPAGIHAVRLSIYNFTPKLPDNANLEMCRMALPTGTTLIIKNPWFKLMADGGLSIRSDNPMNIIRLDEEMLKTLLPAVVWEGNCEEKYSVVIPQAIQIPNFDEYKRQGNMFLVQGRLIEAIKMYTAGIDSVASGDRLELFLNRSWGYQKQSKYDLALADAETALELNSNCLVAHNRKTEALWGLKQFRKAFKFVSKKTVPHFQSIKTTKSEKKQLKTLLESAERNVKQWHNGEYDMAQLVEKVAWKCEKKKTTVEPLDIMHWAEYYGAFEVQKKKETGRGLYATRDINAGELIMASRAFSIAIKELSKEQSEAAGPSHRAIDVDANLIFDELDEAVISKVIEKLMNNFETGKELYSLYAGPELGYLTPDDDCETVDLPRIRQIFRYNAFAHIEPQIPSPRVMDLSPTTAGIWIKPSLLNHSCVDHNASWKIYGNFLFVRANKTIPEGTEIRISYKEPTASLEVRTNIFNKLGFKCNCRLCEVERKDTESIRKKREAAEETMKYMSLVDSPELEKRCLAAVKVLRSTRPGGCQLNPQLIQPLLLLSAYYFFDRQYCKSIEILEELYRITLELCMMEEATGHMANILGCKCKLAERVNKKKMKLYVKRWRETAIATYGSADVLKVRFTETVNHVHDYGMYIFE